MTYIERDVSLAALRAEVRDARARAVPLGAYASENVVHYLFLTRDGILVLRAPVRDGEMVASCTPEMPLYDWDEREMRDERGIRFSDHPDDRPLAIEHGRIPEARTAGGRGVTLVVVGPVHAGIIEPGRFTLSTTGESVQHLDAQLSYSRRGVERALEGRHVVDAAALVARICAACTVSRATAYARCVEALAEYTCDERADLARLVLAELERIYNHLFDLASASAGAGYGRAQVEGLRLKERVMRVCADHARHRFMLDAIQPGGVRADVVGDPPSLRAALREMREEIARYESMLFDTRSLVSRFTGAGIVPRESARALGGVGPAARASGESADVRVDAPYGAYAHLAPSLSLEARGDVLARCRVKVREIGASLELADRALAELGTTRQAAPVELSIRGGRWSAATEGPRGAETISLATDARGTITRMHAISASYRNWPLVARAMRNDIVPDFPLVNKSFNLCYACADR
ncbi:MAG: NADH-quinone oxidoreductase subunit C [bacterium]|nr:NADH-quinone oxidoreductase subunit C [bacterium]